MPEEKFFRHIFDRLFRIRIEHCTDVRFSPYSFFTERGFNDFHRTSVKENHGRPIAGEGLIQRHDHLFSFQISFYVICHGRRDEAGAR